MARKGFRKFGGLEFALLETGHGFGTPARYSKREAQAWEEQGYMVRIADDKMYVRKKGARGKRAFL